MALIVASAPVASAWNAAPGPRPDLLMLSLSKHEGGEREMLSFGPGRPVPPGNALFGQHTFDAICFACHSHDLSGGKAPPLTGSGFYKNWQGKPAGALVDFILNRMPQDDPGSLSEPMARDLVAYIVSYANKSRTSTGGDAGK